VAFKDAVTKMLQSGVIARDPIEGYLAAVSVGVVQGAVLLDLPYQEDLMAEVDMNVVMTEAGKFVEIQGTAEGIPFSKERLDQMLDLAATGIAALIKKQKEVLAQ